MHTFLRSRRSIRHFQARKIELDVLNRVFETCFHAPSAHNRQPWRFAVLSTPDAKKRLADKMSEEFRADLVREGLPTTEVDARIERSKNRINNAPVVIVLCMDESEMDAYPDKRRQQAETIMTIQSAAMAGLQLLLAAHAEGLGAAWTCGPLFAPETVKTALSLPDVWSPQALLLLGYPDETPKEKRIKDFQDVVMFID
jgi:F420 biosynthesis protein FbiB-like protein